MASFAPIAGSAGELWWPPRTESVYSQVFFLDARSVCWGCADLIRYKVG